MEPSYTYIVPNVNLTVLAFQALTMLAVVFSVLGLLFRWRAFFVLAIFASIPLTLYAGIGGNGLIAKSFLLTPVLLYCAGKFRTQGSWMSLALVVAAFLPWMGLAQMVISEEMGPSRSNVINIDYGTVRLWPDEFVGQE